MKDGKSGPGKYYYFLLPNNRSIGVGAQNSTTLLKKKSKILLYDQEVSMTYRLKSEVVSGKLFIYENLRRRTNFQGTFLYLNLAGKNVLYKNGREGPLVERSGC